jgi:L-serine/L-threonine ammonia-lyase
LTKTNTNLYITTPVLENRRLSLQLKKTILNKMECFQPSGSFKNRGLSYLCAHAKQQGKQKLIASSGGNAGLAVAYAARNLGLQATVFVPTTTTQAAIARIEQEGAQVKVEGDVWDETDKLARAAASAPDAEYIPPFDHPKIWEGHSSLCEELKQQIEKPDAIVLSVGGGGLLCGIAQGLRNIAWQDVPIIAAETEGAASFHAAMQAGKVVKLPEITSLATSLGAKHITEQALVWAQQHKIHSAIVSDKQAVRACLQFADDMRVLVEPACGAALAVVYENLSAITAYQNIVVIICGGVGVSLEQFCAWRSQY